MAYSSETSKVIDMPNVMRYVTGRVADIGCGGQKVTPDAFGVDGRQLPGVDVQRHDLFLQFSDGLFNTIFSSHFLEHTPYPYEYIMNWRDHLQQDGHLVLYLPQKGAYNSQENLEHIFDWSYEDFLFFFKRSFCGEGKTYKGEYLPKMFDLVDSGLDIGEDRYSFYIIGKRV